jgi:hypothetical protein
MVPVSDTDEAPSEAAFGKMAMLRQANSPKANLGNVARLFVLQGHLERPRGFVLGHFPPKSLALAVPRAPLRGPAMGLER